MESAEILQWLVALARCFEEETSTRVTCERARQREGIDAELVAEYFQDLANLKAGHDQVGQKVRVKERTIQDLEAQAARKRRQLDGIRDNKEYRALMDEVGNLERLIDTTETDMLQLLEQSEAQQQRIQALEREILTKRAEIAARTEELQTIAAEAETKLAEVTREIATCYDQLPRELVLSITRLQENLPLPVVWLDGEACGGCHAHFPTQTAIEIARNQSVVRCQACGRFVVSRD